MEKILPVPGGGALGAGLYASSTTHRERMMMAHMRQMPVGVELSVVLLVCTSSAWADASGRWQSTSEELKHSLKAWLCSSQTVPDGSS